MSKKVPVCSRCKTGLFVKPYTKIRFKGIPVYMCRKCGKIISPEVERFDNVVNS